MEARSALVAEDVAATMVAYRDGLRTHQQAINRLNVYPVPDGDTGTNMALTLDAVVAELDTLEGCSTMAGVCQAVAHGSLMGARGNSGVILSQLLRGVAERFRAAARVGSDEVADALVVASDLARRAVVRPVEGTILTVARAAGEGATLACQAGGDLLAVVEGARRSAARALEETPTLLEVLARAGVVDAGGSGYLLLLDALLSVLDGRAMPDPPPPADGAGANGRTGSAGYATSMAAGGGEPGGGLWPQVGPRYEVMYLLEAVEDTIPDFKEVWAGLGDSIVVVGGDGLWNCHIHTDDIGAAIEAGIDAGRPRGSG